MQPETPEAGSSEYKASAVRIDPATEAELANPLAKTERGRW